MQFRKMTIGSAILGSLLLLGPVDATQRKGIPRSIDLVEIDVAVVDRLHQPVTGLTAKDFVVRDDGAPVMIKTFREVHFTSVSDPDYRRSITLLLDDVAVPAEGTQAVQTIGKAFLQSVDARDEVSVVRLHDETDEPSIPSRFRRRRAILRRSVCYSQPSKAVWSTRVSSGCPFSL
jgi:hypothetical protein